MASEITAKQRSFIRKKTKHHDLDPSEMAGELNIVPFLDIVMNIIMFLLATSQAVLAVYQLDAQLPSLKAGGRSSSAVAEDENPLNLSVTVTEEGVIVSTSFGKLLPDCQNFRLAAGKVISIPRTGTGQDWKRVTMCLEGIKQKKEEENKVIIGADPTIRFEDVIKAMDAVTLNSKGKPLFPEVALSAGVR